jgi:hypothetical protein
VSEEQINQQEIFHDSPICCLWMLLASLTLTLDESTAKKDRVFTEELQVTLF